MTSEAGISTVRNLDRWHSRCLSIVGAPSREQGTRQAAEKRRPDGEWEMVDGKNNRVSDMCHLRFAIQDAFFSIMLTAVVP
jgi:hypothetical protein